MCIAVTDWRDTQTWQHAPFIINNSTITCQSQYIQLQLFGDILHSSPLIYYSQSCTIINITRYLSLTTLQSVFVEHVSPLYYA